MSHAYAADGGIATHDTRCGWTQIFGQDTPAPVHLDRAYAFLCCCDVIASVRAAEREAAAQRVIKQGVSIVAGRPPQEYIMLSLAVAAVRGEQT